jgi:hypothetical protein
MDASSLACFRYALPIFFIYLINAYLSVKGEGIRLDKAIWRKGRVVITENPVYLARISTRELGTGAC